MRLSKHIKTNSPFEIYSTSALSLHKKQSSTYNKYACGCFLCAPSICTVYFKRLTEFLFSVSWVNASDRYYTQRRIIEVVRPFEPSSTDVHPCTSVEGEFCAYTKHRCCMEPLPSMAVLIEPPILFCGAVKKYPDAFTLPLF